MTGTVASLISSNCIWDHYEISVRHSDDHYFLQMKSRLHVGGWSKWTAVVNKNHNSENNQFIFPCCNKIDGNEYLNSNSLFLEKDLYLWNSYGHVRVPCILLSMCWYIYWNKIRWSGSLSRFGYKVKVSSLHQLYSNFLLDLFSTFYLHLSILNRL